MSLKLGVALPSFATDGHRAPPSRLKRFARRAEEFGFAGLWTLEHLTIPPTYNQSWLNQLVTLGFAAGVTSTIPLGTSIHIMPMRNPVLLAERVATLQHLSEERFTLGAGLGYVEYDFDAVNVPFGERGRRFTEGVRLLHQLLREDSVTFDGEFFQVEDFRLEPSVQRPPRIIVGGGGTHEKSSEADSKERYAEQRVGDRYVPRPILERIRSADGWIAAPLDAASVESDRNDVVEYLEAEGDGAGRPDLFALDYVHVIPNKDTEEAREEQAGIIENFVGPKRGVEYALNNYLTGSVEDIRERLAHYEDLGFEQVVLGPMAKDPAELNRQLELIDDRLLSTGGTLQR